VPAARCQTWVCMMSKATTKALITEGVMETGLPLDLPKVSVGLAVVV
jgi:hypothetical protein